MTQPNHRSPSTADKPQPVSSLTTVVIAEACAMMAETMALAIEQAEGLSLTASCASPGEIAGACAETAPDVLVLDLNLYGCDPYLAMASLREHAIEARSLMLCPDLDARQLADALLAGANNCISALVDRHFFLLALRATAEDRMIVGPEHHEIVAHLLAEHARNRERRLSGREVEVLRLLALNASIADIAARLFISVNTVNKHLAHSYRKLGAHNRSGAIAAAKRAGLI